MKTQQIKIACENFEKLAKKIDPKAKVRSRGKCALPAEHPKVKDKKDHYPLNDIAQARNALARVNQMKSSPDWFNGTLQQLVNTVVRAVKKEFPSIEVSEKAKKPGKG